MENRSWWHVAVTAITVVLGVMVLLTVTEPVQRVGALVSLAVFAIGWFTVGRLSWHSTPMALAFSGIVIVTISVAVGFEPYLAILQCVAYPLLWVIASTTRAAIVANVLLAVGVGVGFWFSTGSIAQVTLTAGLSLVFSLALGLWITRIAEHSEERQRLIDELREAQNRLAAVNRDAGVASERERLAREIHDTIAQDLTGLVMLTQNARRELAVGHPARADEQLALIEENARMALAETRALVAASAPVRLATGGITEALNRLAQRFSRETGVTVGVEADDVPPLERDTEVVLLRVAQEGLANVRKHSGAESAVIVLSVRDGKAHLEVRDDGAGFDTTAASDGFGLAGMRDRLALVHGALDVSSSTEGTVLVATLPVTA